MKNYTYEIIAPTRDNLCVAEGYGKLRETKEFRGKDWKSARLKAWKYAQRTYGRKAWVVEIVKELDQ